MKADRLIGILSVLLRHERVTAPYLAEKCEVSRRTVSRDIDALCRAGIPVITIQGAGGGISIAEGYKIDKALFTSKELKAIFAGLRGLDSISEKPPSEWIFSKFLAEGLVEDLTQGYFQDQISVTALFDEDVQYRLVEEYGPGSFTRTPENRLLFHMPFTNQERLIEWILSFGDKAELLEPKELRGLLRQKLEKSLARYSEQDS